ncbi:MAG: outer membrane protein transport protein [Gemmatimonadota bacterium]|nr:MAG: outer membrane protein transport protein [Gemmatimonadota bacterium]
MKPCFKKRIITLGVILSLTGICLSGDGYAQDEVLIGKFFGSGARAMGMGGAFLAVADDYSALYWNPAGLAQIPRLEISGSLSHDRMRNNATYYGFGMKDSQSKTRLNALGLAYPLPTVRGSLVLGLGYNRLSSFDNLLTINSNRMPTQYVDALETESGGLSAWSIGGAIDVSPSLSLGGALNIWTGDDRYTWDYLVSDTQDPFRDYRYLDTIDGDYSGVGLKFGALLRARRYASFGLTVTSPVTFTVKEFWTQQTDTLFFRYYDEGEFEYEITTPYRVGLGGSIAFRHLTLAADVEYVDWTQTEYKSPYWMISDNWVFKNSYREVYTYHMGAEYAIPRSDVTLRAGYYNDPLPRNDGRIQRDRDYVTVGAGFLVDNTVKIDVAVVHGLWEKTTDNLTEKIQADRVFLSMAYRF